MRDGGLFGDGLQNALTMAENPQPKWEAEVSATIRAATAEQIWPLIKDFFNLHKWFPTLSTCYGIHGGNGEPGCVRFCGGSSIPSTTASTDGNRPASWSKERLIFIDDVERCLSYEIVGSNIGFVSYVSTMKVDGVAGGGCLIQWSFSVDPVEGMSFDELVSQYTVGLQRMAKKMEHAFNSRGGDHSMDNPNI